MKFSNDKQLGYVLLIGTICFASISFLSLEYVYRNFPGVNAINASVFGFLIGCLLYGFYFFPQKKKRSEFIHTFKEYYKLILGVSLMTSVGSIIWFYCLYRSNSGIMALLGNMEILWAVLLGVLLLKEKLNMKQVFGMILGLCGVIVIGNLRGESDWVVIALFSFGSLMYALQSYFFKRYGTESAADSFSYIRALFLVTILGVFFLSFGKLQVPHWIPLLILGLGQMSGLILSRTCYFKAHKYLPISQIHMFFFLEPVVVVLLGVYMFGHSLSMQKVLGALVILSGIFLIFQGREKNTKQKLRTKS